MFKLNKLTDDLFLFWLLHRVLLLLAGFTGLFIILFGMAWIATVSNGLFSSGSLRSGACTLIAIGIEVTCLVLASQYKLKRLVLMFGDVEIAKRIIKKTIRQGDTPEIVKEMLGKPAAVDEIALSTAQRVIWKFKKGRDNRSNQYSLRITFEDGIVTGWEDRN